MYKFWTNSVEYYLFADARLVSQTKTDRPHLDCNRFQGKISILSKAKFNILIQKFGQNQ